MVAKSYQSYEVLTEPYTANKRQYVRVRNPKTGNERQVRWYTEKEYTRLYPQQTPQTATSTQKEALGFTDNYIIILGDSVENYPKWRKENGARYARWWGWYIPTTLPAPISYPSGATPITLPWDSVGLPSGQLKPEAQVKEVIESLLYEPQGDFIGNINDRIEVSIIVSKNIPLEDSYGSKHLHVMTDANGNEYIWTTSAQNLKEGSQLTIKGKIKDHRTYKGKRQTILTNCRRV